MILSRILIAWVFVLLLTAVAVAQNQIGDGRMLDNNMQQGAGGYNAGQPQDARINSGNAVVTGNVPGLQYFHGNVGYTAPGEFGGNLSGDNLFRFRAQSYNPTIGAAPIPRAAMGYEAAPTVEIYRSGAQPSVRGISSTGTLYGYRSSDPGTGIQVFQPSYGMAGTPLGAPVTVGAPIGLVQSAAGWSQLQASPLLGIRQQMLGVSSQGSTQNTLQGALPGLPGAAQQRQAVGAWLPGEMLQDGTEIQVAPSAALQANPSARQTINQPNEQAEPLLAPSLLLGAQVQGRLDEQVAAAPEAAAESTQALRNRLLPRTAAAEGADGQRGQTAYANLLRQLRAAQAEGTPQVPGSPTEALAQQDERMQQTEEQERVAAAEQEAQQEPTVNVQPPTREESSQAQQAREQAIARASGLRQPAVEPQQQRRQDATLSPAFAELLERINFRMPPVASMAGQSQGALAEAYRTAEAALAKGQYFQAMEQYRQIQQRWPGEPMARAGQVHAAMGAGMVRSAALGLRRLLEQHPELIAVRYEARLLPSEERLQWVRDQLQDMISKGATPDAATLLAYLGYQINSPELTRYGLDLAQTASPQDPLLALLRQIWVHDADAQPAAQSSAPAPAAQ